MLSNALANLTLMESIGGISDAGIGGISDEGTDEISDVGIGRRNS